MRQRTFACVLAIAAALVAPAVASTSLRPTPLAGLSLKAPVQDVHLSSSGAKFIADFEGTYLYCYRDPVGIWTIGIGHVGCSQGQRITQARAYELLQQDAETAASAIRVGVRARLNQQQVDALISFTFNVGNQAFLESTLLRELNAGYYDRVPVQLNRWVNAGGHPLSGLVRRRAAEGALFLSGVKALRKLTASQLHHINATEKASSSHDLRAAIVYYQAQINRSKTSEKVNRANRDVYQRRVTILRREKNQARARLHRLTEREQATAAGAVAALHAKATAPPQNGRLPKSVLAPIFNASGLHVFLAKAPAAAWNSMALLAAERRDLATPDINGPASAYRTYDQQVELRRYWCGQGSCQNAAVPGTSNHGLGLAADVPGGTQVLIRAIGREFGWDKACSDAPWEAWHHKWCGGWDHPDPGVDRQNPVLRRGSGGPGQVKWVRLAQRRLTKHAETVDADGTYGLRTKRAVKHFQDHHDLGPTGVVGKDTWRELRSSP